MSREETKGSDYLPTMMASSLAGVVARIPTHPIDTCKARLQTQTWLSSTSRTHTLYGNLKDALRSIWRTEGLRGLYRGFGITALGSAPASCLYFTSYEVTKQTLSNFTNTSSQFYVHFVAGMVAETISCVLWVPIDVLKERMQIQRVPTSASDILKPGTNTFYATGFEAITQTLKREGMLGFYRGYGATVMSFGPFSAFYFMFYEKFKSATKALGNYKDEKEMNFALFLLCGAGAGSAASFVTNPLDLVKLRLQVQRGQASKSMIAQNESHKFSVVRYRNIVDGLIKLYQYEGIAGFTRGVHARIAFHASSTAISIAAFEELKIRFSG